MNQSDRRFLLQISGSCNTVPNAETATEADSIRLRDLMEQAFLTSAALNSWYKLALAESDQKINLREETQQRILELQNFSNIRQIERWSQITKYTYNIKEGEG